MKYIYEILMFLTWPLTIWVSYVLCRLALNYFDRHRDVNE